MDKNFSKSIKRIISIHNKEEIRRQSKGELPFIGLSQLDRYPIKAVLDSAEIYEKYSL